MVGKPFTLEEQKKFERIRELVLGTVRRMDNKKGLNIKRYEEIFKAFEQDPDSFRNWEMLRDDSLDSCPVLYQLPFEEVRMNQVKDAADFLGIELEEYIYYRHHDSRGVRSKMKVPVGYISIKRLQQILSKKNHYTHDMDDRSLKTGDVKGNSKAAAISEPETYALMAIGGNRILEELLGPRADNIEKKHQMYREIARDGFATLDSLKSSRSSSTTLNTINTYLLASGIRSDLITDTLKTEYTLNQDLKNNK